ncbi:MAG: dihydrodipicolinate synthase family protein [Pirellulales bacterium]
MTDRLEGLIAAPHTPFAENGKLQLDGVEPLAAHLAATGVAGAFIAGTTGEGLSMSVDERRSMAEAWGPAARKHGLRLVVHVGAAAQCDAIALAEHARRVEADAIAAMGPPYYRPATVDDLVTFCEPIAAAAGSLPFYYYHIPDWTGVRLPMDAFLRRGRDRIATLRGLKFTSSDLAQYQLCARTDGGAFDILFGSDEIMLAALAVGARGFVGSTYNFAAPLYHRIRAAFEAGDFPAAAALQETSVRMVGEIAALGFLAASKRLMRCVGVDCGPVRSPLADVDSSRVEALAGTLRTLGAIA